MDVTKFLFRLDIFFLERLTNNNSSQMASTKLIPVRNNYNCVNRSRGCVYNFFSLATQVHSCNNYILISWLQPVSDYVVPIIYWPRTLPDASWFDKLFLSIITFHQTTAWNRTCLHTTIEKIWKRKPDFYVLSLWPWTYQINFSVFIYFY